MNAKNKQQESQSPWRYWRGLGAWNYYFLLKFALLWFGYLNFHPLANLVFLAFLLFPIPAYRVHRWRHWLAIPIGIGLLYHDTHRYRPALSRYLAARHQQHHEPRLADHRF